MRLSTALGVSTCTLIGLFLSQIAAEPAFGDEPQPRSGVVQGSNAFAFDLYGRFSGGTGNVIYSPYSVSTALAMTRLGANGETAAQMTRVLHLPDNTAQLAAGYNDLIAEINGKGRPRQFQLLTTNALWPQKGFPFHPAYVSTLQSNFGASVQELDYITDPNQARMVINRFVAEQTKQKIPELFGEGSLNRNSRLVLTNTIYFKADWATAFKKEATQPKDFHLDASKAVQVPMMSQTQNLPYLEGDGFQAVELPYKDKDVAMLIILPRQQDGLAALEKSLPKELLSGGLNKPANRKVKVSLPRFKISYEANLTATLKAMGMPLAFTPKADFAGMSEEKLWIDLVIHKAVIEVDEEGTVAAAATGVVMRTASAAPQEPIIFNADHPFLFAIRDKRTGCILFMGRVTNPQG